MLEHDAPIQSTAEAYFKLQLLSHRLALPNTLNLDGIFAQLPNVAWTSDGAIDVGEIEAALIGSAARRASADGALARQISAHDRLRDLRAACASPTRRGSVSARISAKAPP